MISNLVTSLRIILLVPLCGLLLAGHGAASRWLALVVLLVAGLTDVLDGRIARALGEASAFGALLDLIADRLLTLGVLGALIACGELKAWGAVAALILIARDLVVASFAEALPGRLGIRVSALERAKIALHFLAMGLLVAPEVWRAGSGLGPHEVGAWLLAAAAALAVVTVVGYARRAAAVYAGRP